MAACGSQPKQTAFVTENSPVDAAGNARNKARFLASQACKAETCGKGECTYIETRIEGKTLYSPTTKKWTSSQTTSGKCACTTETERISSCKRECEQTVTAFGDKDTEAADKAMKIARKLALSMCEGFHCDHPEGTNEPKCVYEETTIVGQTWKDTESGKYISWQISTGKCRCEAVWL